MEIEICSQCRGLVLDPGETVFAIKNELDRLSIHLSTRLKVKLIVAIVCGMFYLKSYVLRYLFG